jgi:hypothetical protein
MHPKTYWTWLNKHDRKYSPQGFRQHGIQPKVLTRSETSRRDWRARNQFNRDKSKNRRFCYDKGNRWYKDQDHRARRAWERNVISQQKWDVFCRLEHSDQHSNSYDWW